MSVYFIFNYVWSVIYRIGQVIFREYLRGLQEIKTDVVWTREKTKAKNTSEERLGMVPPGRRKRGRPKQRWMDCFNRDMRAIGTEKDEVHDRTGWTRIVSAGATPQLSRSG